MSPLNYKHLYYFYVVANEGSIVAASKKLNVTSQTISGQLTAFEQQLNSQLFERKGKRLLISNTGQMIYRHAEEIFQLGSEIQSMLKTQQPITWQNFHVGITDVIPKMLAYQILQPALALNPKIHLVCHEGDQDSLLASLAINKIDMVLSDQPLAPGSHIKAYNHQLTESGFTFFAIKAIAEHCRTQFPDSLSGQPFLLQGKKSTVRQRLNSWLQKQNILPNIIAEFDDSALMKSFGQAGFGIFTGPTLFEREIVNQYQVEIIGRTSAIKEHYYAISPERTLKHPATLAIVQAITDN